MKKLTTTLLALLLAASQWAIGQSGSNCPDAIPQVVQLTQLPTLDTLSFPTTSSELWLEFQAPSDGLGLTIDYKRKSGSGGTDVIAIEVYLQIGSCANLQLVATKSLAVDSTVLVELSSTVPNAIYSFKLTKDTNDVRNNDVVGAILKSGFPAVCYESSASSGFCHSQDASGTVGHFHTNFNGDIVQTLLCTIDVCIGDVVCYSGFTTDYQTIPSNIDCSDYSFTGDNYWFLPGTNEFDALPLGESLIYYPTINDKVCVTYNTAGVYPVFFYNTYIPNYQPPAGGYVVVNVYDVGPTILSDESITSYCEGDAISFCFTTPMVSDYVNNIYNPYWPQFSLTIDGQVPSEYQLSFPGYNSQSGSGGSCFSINPANAPNYFPTLQPGIHTYSITGIPQTRCQSLTTVSGSFEITPLFDWQVTPINCSLSIILENFGCYTAGSAPNSICFDMGDGTGISSSNCTNNSIFGYNYTTPGTYTITIYYQGDLIETLTVTVVGELLATEIISDYITKCCVYGAEYTVPNNYVSYTWTVIDGTITAGQGTNSITVNWDAQAPGSYVYVTVVDANGCEATAEMYVDRCCSFTPPTNVPFVVETDYCEATYMTDLIPLIGLTVGSSVYSGNGVIAINNELIIDTDFTFLNCPNIYLAPNAKITLETGKILSIRNSTLQNKCDDPWDGIFVGDVLSFLEAKNSYFTGAKNVVVSENGGKYDIGGSSFVNNNIGIWAKNYTSTLTGNVSNSTFISNANTIFPNRSKYGMLIENINDITIGVVNTFENLDFGIHITNSNVKCHRNLFKNITLLPGGILYNQGVAIYDDLRKGLPETSLIAGSSQANKNTFDNCHVGVYTLGNINILSRYNVMTNMNYAGFVTRDNLDVDVYIQYNNIKLSPGLTLGIYLWGPTLINASILNNSINLGAVPFGATYVAGIVVNQIATGSNNLIVIKNNTVRQCQFGIYANNAPSIIIESNTVQYQDNAGFTGNVYGVFATGSSFGQIKNNTVTRIGSAPTNANQKLNFVGIHAENSPNVLIFKNASNFFGKGIQAKGNNNQSTMQCNTLTRSFNGVFLESAFTGNQGIPSAPQDNKWVANVENKISGSASNTGAIWYHRNNGVYDINPYSQPLSSVNATITNSINFSCLNGPIGPGGGLGPKSLLRPIIFDPIVYDTKTFMGFDSIMRFIDQLYTRINFAQDTTWLAVGAPNDADYVNYYAATQQTNLGKFCTIAKSYETNDTTALRSANTALNTSVCHFSKGLQDVNQVFLDTWAAENYELSAQQTQLMEDLACSDALVNGPAVYGARAILGVFFECSNGYQKSALVETESTEQEGTALKEDVVLLVYPNPSQGEVFLNYFIGERTEATVLVYDISGKLLQSIPVETHQGIIQINNPFYQAGAYIYHVVSKGEMLGTGKFIIE